MFFQLIGYRLRCLLRDKELVFWTLLFPLLLSTLFHFAFSNLLTQEPFDPVPCAVVDNAAYQQDELLRQVLASVSEGDERLLTLETLSAEDAQQALSDGRIAGYLVPGETLSLTVAQEGLPESILTAFCNAYVQSADMVTQVAQTDPAALPEVLAQLGDERTYLTDASFSPAPPDIRLIYFYTLIAMTCLYGGFWGLRNTTDLQANLSPQGARRSLAPTKKMSVVLTDSLAAFALQLVEVLLLLAYLHFVLRIEFGSQLGYVLLVCVIGSAVGVALGSFVGTMLRKSDNIKLACLIACIMILSFLAGLMYVDMKYIVATHVPILAYLNPVALISDAFYCLYVYTDHHRFFLNIGLLCAFGAVFTLVSVLKMRREKFVSL
ncbi:MAG: ABC transporter permease [Christensenellales bacterium]|jgi:ABC-2 type transport system permease protein